MSDAERTPSPEFPRGIEQARRDFMQADPTLYAYIEARIMARTWRQAGDITSGAASQYGSSNRCYVQQSRFHHRVEEMLEQHPGPSARGERS